MNMIETDARRFPPALQPLALSTMICALVSGCAVTPERCDPSKPTNIINAAVCDMGGTSAARVDSKRRRASNAAALAEQMREDNARLAVESAETSAQRAELDRKLRNLYRENAKLRSDIDKLETQSVSQQRAKERLLSEIDDLDSRIQAVRTNADGASADTSMSDETRKLQDRRDQLMKEFDELTEAISGTWGGRAIGAESPGNSGQ